jgi:sec-independent protein translocase protein TatA
MGGLSPIHWLIILVIVVIVFGGRGKISGLMGDIGKGINSFKAGLKDDETRRREQEEAARTGTIDHARPVGSQTVDNGVRQDDVVRR